mmetsp:Transcript_42558/g.99236  ORF Transcript_42558/g.99236 Transcript_42558/m.99236 type:complete len:400 (+) Transcript_42558:24-1223(+)
MWLAVDGGDGTDYESVELQEERTLLIERSDKLEAVKDDSGSSDEALKTSRRWRFTTGFFVCLGAVLAVVLFYPTRLRAHRHFSKHLEGLEEWEEIPNISSVISRAEGLHQATPLRNLRDLFAQYAPYRDDQLPWLRAECVIDAVQATNFLVQAVVFLYKAIDYTGLECPDNTQDGCAVSVAGFIASVSWVASFLSLAASSCGDAVNSGALCAADWTALMADFAEVASSGAAVKSDCDFGVRISGLLPHIDFTRKTHPYYHWRRFFPAGAGPAVVLARKRHYNTMRDFDVTQCVVDVTNAASYLVRAALQIRTATIACPEPRACTIDIMEVISSFSWISRFVSNAASDCSNAGNQKAQCAADVSNLVAAVANGPAAGLATTSDCADYPDTIDELKHEPTT